jgi:shikimate kinase
MRERERNIVLTGFRATGKTAAGRQLADRLGYTFVDLDSLMETEAGGPLPQLIAERGEAGARELEIRMVERVAVQKRCVIATGGRTIVNPRNLRVLKQSGVVVALTADPETILSRMGSGTDDPRLCGGPTRLQIEQLLAEGRDAYAQADATVDTSARTIDEVVDCILHAVKCGPFRAPRGTTHP